MNMRMSIKESIKKKIEQGLAPLYLDIVDESEKHSRGRESHFKVLIVSERFRGQSRLDRQRLVNGILREELSGLIHALAQRLMTPEEWRESTTDFQSPDCAHRK